MQGQRLPAVAAILLLAASVLGCAPRIVGRRLTSNGAITPDESDPIPYYLPKPYLLVTHHMADAQADAAAEKAKKAAPGEPAVWPRAGHSLRIIYLPDLHNRYGLEVTRGTGSFDGSFALKDGWMLTSLGAKSDNQLDESLEATAKLVESLGGLASGAPDALAAPRLSADTDASLELIDLASGRCVLGWPDGCPQGGEPLGPGLCGDGCSEGLVAAERGP
jgi:hypothetical protein